MKTTILCKVLVILILFSGQDLWAQGKGKFFMADSEDISAFEALIDRNRSKDLKKVEQDRVKREKAPARKVRAIVPFIKKKSLVKKRNDTKRPGYRSDLSKIREKLKNISSARKKMDKRKRFRRRDQHKNRSGHQGPPPPPQGAP